MKPEEFDSCWRVNLTSWFRPPQLRETKHEYDEDDEDEDVWDEWTHDEDDLQAVVIISAAQVIWVSVHQLRLVRVKG